MIPLKAVAVRLETVMVVAVTRPPRVVTVDTGCSGTDSVPVAPPRETLGVTTALHWLLSREVTTPVAMLRIRPRMMVKAPLLSVVAVATTVLLHTTCTVASGRPDRSIYTYSREGN